MQFEKTKTVKANRRTLRVTGVFCLNGQIQTAGNVVEVSDFEGLNLIARRLAVDATQAEVTAAAGSVVVATHRENTWADA